MNLKKINLYFGLTLFIGFLITGYFMKTYFRPEFFDNHVVRMQIRSNHIYILFISLLNVVAFKCDLRLDHRSSRFLDSLSRLLLIASGILAVFAFLNEHTGDLSVRTLTLFTVILSVASVGMLLLNELIYLIKKKKDSER